KRNSGNLAPPVLQIRTLQPWPFVTTLAHIYKEIGLHFTAPIATMIIILKIPAINVMGTHLATHATARSPFYAVTTLTVTTAAANTLPTASAAVATVLMPHILHINSPLPLQLSKTFSL
ncbi:unnamed protein product, partial [Prunus brigantina]